MATFIPFASFYRLEPGGKETDLSPQVRVGWLVEGSLAPEQ